MTARYLVTTALGSVVAFIIGNGNLHLAYAQESMMSVPPDLTDTHRPLVPEDLTPGGKSGTRGRNFIPPPSDFDLRIVDTIVSNTDPNLKNTDINANSETSIAIHQVAVDDRTGVNEPRHGKQTVVDITAFNARWGTTAPLFHSEDAGQTWTRVFSITAPRGVDGTLGCPCDQTLDYDHFGQLAGTFLTFNPTNIYSGISTDPNLTASFQFFENPPGTAEATNHLVATSLGNADQPWLLTGPANQESDVDPVYVAYDDFGTDPVSMRVAVADDAVPPQFTVDVSDGNSLGAINPGHRLAVDHDNGVVWSSFQQNPAAGADDSKNIDYFLNRSTDHGVTWTLNGSAGGIIVANADSTQPTPKFCTVNALLGGVEHITVDPKTHDLLYVYGARDAATGNNRLALKRIHNNPDGTVTVGPAVFVTGQVQAAIPQVAAKKDGTIGVFYYTCDGASEATGLPVFTAHFSISDDLGVTFTDIGLLTFLSTTKDNGDPRQRVLGDYMQTKVNGDTFYGSFSGNGAAFGRPFANIDPIFFSVKENKKKVSKK